MQIIYRAKPNNFDVVLILLLLLLFFTPISYIAELSIAPKRMSLFIYNCKLPLMIFQCRGVYKIYKYDIYVLLVISCLMRSQSSSGSKSFSTQFALVGWWLRLNGFILHVRAEHISNMTTLSTVRPRPCLSTQLT